MHLRVIIYFELILGIYINPVHPGVRPEQAMNKMAEAPAVLDSAGFRWNSQLSVKSKIHHAQGRKINTTGRKDSCQ